MLREWVNNGGVLIAGGGVSLYRADGGQQGNYLLNDVFGLNHAGNMDVSDPKLIDTYCIMRHGSMPKAVSGAEPENFRHMVFRAVKPESGPARPRRWR